MKKIKKKTTKVKKKTVKLKKVVKKKTVKNKAVKKKKSKNVKKTRRRKKKILMEDIYAILNKVQVGKKKITFATDIKDAPIIENNIKDVELKYKKAEMRTQVVFTIYPNDTEYEDDHMLKLEIMDDEIPDIDQIFG